MVRVRVQIHSIWNPALYFFFGFIVKILGEKNLCLFICIYFLSKDPAAVLLIAGICSLVTGRVSGYMLISYLRWHSHLLPCCYGVARPWGSS